MSSAEVTCLEVFQRKHAIDILLFLEGKTEGFNKIAETLQINTATLQTRLEDLIAKNFIEKHECEQDSRAYKYSQTKRGQQAANKLADFKSCLLYTSPSPRDRQKSRMPSSA